MANNVYANGREVSCKAADGKTICAFPDVCMTPPENPATPPGIPIPYPNTGMAKDTAGGSKKVKISGKETMLKNQSHYKKSMGDEAGSAAKKGVVTSVNRGKVYFNSWSMDVKFEGKNVVRHLDLTTHNHASAPGQTPPFPNLDKMKVGGESCREILKRARIEVHQHKNAKCTVKHEYYESDHMLQNACFESSRRSGGITACPKYKERDAPCICLKGESGEVGSQHYRKTQSQSQMGKDWRADGKKTVPYKDVRDKNLEAIADARSTPPSDEAMECLKKIVDHYFKKYLGLKDNDPVRVPITGKYRKPPRPR